MEINTNMIGTNPFKTRRKKFGIGSLIISMVIGVAFAGSGILFYKSTNIPASWIRTEGTVVGANPVYGGSHGGTTYAAVIKYTVSGQSYSITANSSSSFAPTIGSQREIAYNPSAPAEAKSVSGAATKSFALIFAGLGGIIIFAAPLFYVKSLRRTADINNLTQSGQKIRGIITDIQQRNTGGNSTSSGATQYRIIVSATGLDGMGHNYTSDWITGIGGLAMADFRSNPIPIDVYVNAANPDDYYVDISEVPSLTPERIAELIRSASSSYSPHSIAPPTAAVPPAQSPEPMPGLSQPGAPVQLPPAPVQTPQPPSDPNNHQATGY